MPTLSLNGVQLQGISGGAADGVELSGPIGGPGGLAFQDRPLPELEVAEVRVFGGNFIDAIQLVYRNRFNPNQFQEGPKHGGPGGTLNEPLGLVLQLRRGEFIIGIQGRCGNFVDSLQIQTNFQLFNKSGGVGGANTYVFQTAQGEEIVGFHGRAGNFVDAIGAMVRNRPA